jgi:hypothetical protein
MVLCFYDARAVVILGSLISLRAPLVIDLDVHRYSRVTDLATCTVGFYSRVIDLARRLVRMLRTLVVTIHNFKPIQYLPIG